ncbi:MULTISPECIES: EAL domain-containing protein [Acidithiobacillus]|uniref:EAL domain-containing protein n=2 Tax=Acidithiobacillus TaxID=119977 RepID=A0A179BM50_ACIFR|nr:MULTISPECIES: EAL domain-containing protein [Acidithiobacillus]MDA8152192.1 EAL domain-containing protein [Acidithiobacillus sp.]MBU2830999.1 EAL domain-containing protein [Acidithiobacillus ferriphilus]MBU2833526.1 EAL domain-containing protein [Acidithiobacillus ferriphilus]MBU2853068.1 EAL domain-containing protein [Acidithiobacillus ferriphilus]MEB8485801.1 EAL domain-containing protein [Acidithiobacillus ferriphilus]
MDQHEREDDGQKSVPSSDSKVAEELIISAGGDVVGSTRRRLSMIDPYDRVDIWLNAVKELLCYYSETVVADFYDTLMRAEASAHILSLLSDAEMAHLKTSQVRYLTQVLSPGISREKHMSMAREAGMRHTWIGLPADILAQSFQVYRAVLEDTINSDLANSVTLQSIIMERLSNDLSWQLMAYTEAENERADTLENIRQIISTAINREDIIRETLQRIVKIPGITGVEIVSVGENYGLRCELSFGNTLHESQSQEIMEWCAIERDNLLLQAWRDEKPVQIDSIQKELSPEEWTKAQALGLRSMAIHPILTLAGAPQILMTLYSPWPGYFHPPWQQSFWASLEHFFGDRLETLEKSSVIRTAPSISLQDRRRYRELLQNDGLEMWYQPVVNPGTHRIVKAEALARLRDDDHLISPYFFLPAFGSTQLLSLFEKGLQQIHKDAQRWVAKKIFPPSLSINLPPEAFQHPAFLQKIARWGATNLLQQNHPGGTGPLKITLEILETGALDEASAQEQILLLRNAGFRIALDDVGSGESSLNRLRALSIDEIKIDQSFICALEKNPDTINFVIILANLANDLNMACVAEGVENDAIADMLASIGGLSLQGYIYAKPMPATELAGWATEYQQRKEPAHPYTIHGWFAKWMVITRIVRASLLHMPNLLNGFTINDGIHKELQESLQNLPLNDAHRQQISAAFDEYGQSIIASLAMQRYGEDIFGLLNIGEKNLKTAVYNIL